MNCPSISVSHHYSHCSSTFLHSTKLLLSKIKALAKEIFALFCKACHRAAAHFGAKTWSIPGVVARTVKALFECTINKRKSFPSHEELFCNNTYYHYHLKELSPSMARPYLRYAAATGTAYKGDVASFSEPFGDRLVKPSELGIDPLSLPKGIEVRENCFFDPATGFKALILQRNQELLIAFAAVGFNTVELPDLAANARLNNKMRCSAVANFFGAVPPIYRQADDFLLLMKPLLEAEGKEVVLTGQCFGGSLAAFLGVKYKLRSICFNTFPLGVGIQQKIGEEKLQNADRYITHISVKNDPTSDLWGSSMVDRIFNLIGIKTPGNFGRRFFIPSAYSTLEQTHNFSLGSMMKHLGYHCRAKPCDVDLKLILQSE